MAADWMGEPGPPMNRFRSEKKEIPKIDKSNHTFRNS